MQQRHRNMERLLKVQKQLHKMAELKLIDLHRQEAELRSAQDAIIQSMNDHDALHGLFVDVMAKRLHALAGQTSRVETAKIAQREVAVDKAMQAKRTEKVVSGLQDELRRDAEKKNLLAILDSSFARTGASFP